MKTLLSRFQTGTGQELFASPPVPAPESIFPLRKALGLDVQTWLFCSHLLLNSCMTDSVLPKREGTVHTQHPSESKQPFPCGTLLEIPLFFGTYPIWNRHCCCLPYKESLFDLEWSYKRKGNISTSDNHWTSPTNSNQSAQHQQLKKHQASKANIYPSEIPVLQVVVLA